MEIFKDVPGYEGIYQVSDLGNVKSLSRFVKHSKGGFMTIKERILKQNIGKDGYLKVNLSEKAKNVTLKTHQLVAILFLNHKPNGFAGLIVDHKDNNKSNNKLSNLQLITQRKNLSKDNVNESGYTGVRKSGKKWRSDINLKGKTKYLGAFNTKLEASNAYQKALLKII